MVLVDFIIFYWQWCQIRLLLMKFLLTPYLDISMLQKYIFGFRRIITNDFSHWLSLILIRYHFDEKIPKLWTLLFLKVLDWNLVTLLLRVEICGSWIFSSFHRPLRLSGGARARAPSFCLWFSRILPPEQTLVQPRLPLFFRLNWQIESRLTTLPL